jgi:hypothetical protein
MSLADAQTAIQQAGLVAVLRNDAVTPTPNIVVAQAPRPAAPVPAGTGVEVHYADSPPLPLLRFKAPAAWGHGGHAYVLTTDPSQQPPNYSPQSNLGRAYPAGATVPGLVAIYRTDCQNCTYPVNHFYSQNSGVAPGGWYPAGIAFYAFGQQQLGTVPLLAMRRGQDEWAWALQGSYEETYFRNDGFDYSYPVCYVWPN